MKYSKLLAEALGFDYEIVGDYIPEEVYKMFYEKVLELKKEIKEAKQ